LAPVNYENAFIFSIFLHSTPGDKNTHAEYAKETLKAGYGLQYSIRETSLSLAFP